MNIPGSGAWNELGVLQIIYIVARLILRDGPEATRNTGFK
jgi:hypothetical protein